MCEAMQQQQWKSEFVQGQHALSSLWSTINVTNRMCKSFPNGGNWDSRRCSKFARMPYASMSSFPFRNQSLVLNTCISSEMLLQEQFIALIRACAPVMFGFEALTLRSPMDWKLWIHRWLHLQCFVVAVPVATSALSQQLMDRAQVFYTMQKIAT